MIITISGTAGSGKSTIANALSEKLNLKKYSVGEYRREKAAKLDMDINEYNKLGEKKSFTDKDADDWQTRLGKEKDNLVIDSRLGFHFVPNSFKIFLDADIKTRAKRIYSDNRESEKFKNFDEALKKVKERQISDEKRYNKYYKLNPFEHKHYDLVIDTTDKDVKEIIKIILEKLNGSRS